MSDEEFEEEFKGADLTAIITFFATWVTAIVMFNFIGLVLGWVPALIVAAVLYFTAPFLYAALGIIFFAALAILSFSLLFYLLLH